MESPNEIRKELTHEIRKELPNESIRNELPNEIRKELPDEINGIRACHAHGSCVISDHVRLIHSLSRTRWTAAARAS